MYPHSEVRCSRQRTQAVMIATEPGSRSSRLALLSRRQHEPVTCRRGSRCTLGPGRRGITACRARRCRAREAAGGRAAVTEASRRPARRSLVQWRTMRSRAPQPHPSVVESAPLRELVGSFAPERLAGIPPLLDAWHSRTCGECHTPDGQRLWARRCGANSAAKFRRAMSTNEEFVYTLSELRVQQASVRPLKRSESEY